MGAEKDKALGKPVKNRDIHKIDEFCALLKNGTRAERYEAQRQILIYFDSYLEKYVNILMGMNSDVTNYDTKGFFSMFLVGKPKDKADLTRQRRSIAKILSKFTREELKQEMVLLFLTVLEKYRIVPGVNALNPLTAIFKWRLKDWYNKLVKEPLFKLYEPTDEDFDLELFMDTIQMSSEEDDSSDKYTESDFNLSWVFQAEKYLYQNLTSYQRYILFLYYTHGYSYPEIGRALALHKTQVKEEIAELTDTLKLVLDGRE